MYKNKKIQVLSNKDINYPDTSRLEKLFSKKPEQPELYEAFKDFEKRFKVTPTDLEELFFAYDDFNLNEYKALMTLSKDTNVTERLELLRNKEVSESDLKNSDALIKISYR